MAAPPGTRLRGAGRLKAAGEGRGDAGQRRPRSWGVSSRQPLPSLRSSTWSSVPRRCSRAAVHTHCGLAPLLGGQLAHADGGRRTGWSAGEEGHLDIDPVLRPLVKSFVSVTKLRALSGAVDEALTTAVSEQPGPVCIRIPWCVRPFRLCDWIPSRPDSALFLWRVDARELSVLEAVGRKQTAWLQTPGWSGFFARYTLDSIYATTFLSLPSSTPAGASVLRSPCVRWPFPARR